MTIDWDGPVPPYRQIAGNLSAGTDDGSTMPSRHVW